MIDFLSQSLSAIKAWLKKSWFQDSPEAGKYVQLCWRHNMHYLTETSQSSLLAQWWYISLQTNTKPPGKNLLNTISKFPTHLTLLNAETTYFIVLTTVNSARHFDTFSQTKRNPVSDRAFKAIQAYKMHFSKVHMTMYTAFCPSPRRSRSESLSVCRIKTSVSIYRRRKNKLIVINNSKAFPFYLKDLKKLVMLENKLFHEVIYTNMPRVALLTDFSLSTRFF